MPIDIINICPILNIAYMIIEDLDPNIYNSLDSYLFSDMKR